MECFVTSFFSNSLLRTAKSRHVAYVHGALTIEQFPFQFYTVYEKLTHRKILKEIQQERKDFEIVKVDMVLNFFKARKDGVLLFPALKVENETISGVLLSRDQIERFLNQFSSSNQN